MVDLISRYASMLMFAAIAAALGLAGWQWAAAAKARSETASARQEFAQYRETQERQYREALQRQIVAKTHSDKLRQEALDAEHLARLAAQADADRLRGTAGQLQRYATDLATSLHSASRDSKATSSSPPAGATADMLALMLGRVDDAAAGIALYADQSRLAGQLCERSYGSLTP